MTESEIRARNPLVLASVGDAVYTLCIRTRLATGDLNARDLHKKAVTFVCARAQKEALLLLEPMLTEDEAYFARRGRNTHPGTVPGGSNIGEYRMATGLETLFGYLYLTGRQERIDEFVDIIWRNQNETV